MKHKSEATTKADEFLANLKYMASSKTDGPIQIVGNVKCDNAGEFLSREFRKMLTDIGIYHADHVPPARPPAERRRDARHPLHDGAGACQPGRE